MDGLSVLFESNPRLEPWLYQRGNALGWLARSEKTSAAPYHLSGRLYLSKSGWLLLAVPNAFVRGLFDALTAPGAELPTAGLMNVPNAAQDSLNAHITVMTADEVAKIGADKINERGHMFHYGLGPVKEIPLNNGGDLSKVWAVQIVSPALSALRKSYGLTPLPNGDHDFHITIACRRKHVMGNNPVSKFDSATGRGELKAANAQLPADVYIITGNPDVDSEHAEDYAQFYGNVKKHIESLGHTVELDPGLPNTVPPGGKYWIGHSRGVDRLKHAPKGVQTLALDDYEPEEARARQAQAYTQLFKTLGVSKIADVPLAKRPKPTAAHYTFNAQQKDALTKLLQSAQKMAADNETTYDCSCAGPCMCPDTCVCKKHGKCGHSKKEAVAAQERVRVVLPYNGKYLLETLNNPKWPANLGKRRFIGGGIEAGETPEQAATREMFEELGVKIKPNAFKHIGNDPNKPHEHYVELAKHKIKPGNFNATVGSDAVISLAEGLPTGADYIGPDLKKLLIPALKKAAEELPWRERVEVYTRHPQSGKIYGGVWAGDKSFAVPGGGIDPGETPEQAAVRELEEETGIKATNPIRLPIPAVDNPWSDKHRAETGRNFAGSRTHFVMVDFMNKLRNKQLDKWDATKRQFYDPAKALSLMEGKQFMAPAVAAGRMAALKHIIEQARQKTAADPEQTILVSGHSGAGKSTLAKALSKKLKIPLHQIDSHPDQKAFFAVNKDGQETIVGSPEYEAFQKLRKRTAEETLAGITGPAIVEGAQLSGMSPEQLALYKKRIFVHTPLEQLLKQRLERQRSRQIAKGNEWTPELEAKKQRIGRAVYDSQNDLMSQYAKIPGTLKYTTHKDDINKLLANLKKTAADLLPGGEADNMPDSKFPPKALAEGKAHEHEHTGNDQIAKEIAKDHLQEDPRYYEKVRKIEGPEAEKSAEKEPAIILQLRAAKAHSDEKRYAQKNEILRKLMHRAPEDWLVDDPEKYHMGITHVPTNFRFHADPKIIPVAVPVQKAASGNPYIAQLFNLDLQKNVPTNATLGQRIFSQFQQAKQQGDWKVRADQNAQNLFAAMDPKYKLQRNMAIARGEWPQQDTLTTLIHNYGDRALGAFA